MTSEERLRRDERAPAAMSVSRGEAERLSKVL